MPQEPVTPDTPETSPNMVEFKKSIDEFHQTFSEFKTINEKAEADRIKYGTELGEAKEALEKANDRLDEIETKVERFNVLPSAPETEKEDEGASRDKAFWHYCRKGLQNLGAENLAELQKATMTVGDDTTGGYLAPSEFVQEIVKGIVEFDPVRSLARVRQTSSRMVMMPSRTSSGAALWTGAELDEAQETGPRYGMESIPVHELSAVIPVSNEDLEDSAFDLEAEFRDDMIEQFAVTEGAGFLTGDGNRKPEGILSNADVDASTESAASGVLDADAMIDLFYELKEGYSMNATWLMKRTTIRDVRKLKETSTDNYLWQPGLADGSPANILGAPYRESPGMPAVAGSAKAVLLGDFRRGYVIIDRTAISILRDDYSQARAGVVEFIARKRVGGQVLIPEAFKVLTIKA